MRDFPSDCIDWYSSFCATKPIDRHPVRSVKAARSSRVLKSEPGSGSDTFSHSDQRKDRWFLLIWATFDRVMRLNRSIELPVIQFCFGNAWSSENHFGFDILSFSPLFEYVFPRFDSFRSISGRIIFPISEFPRTHFSSMSSHNPFYLMMNRMKSPTRFLLRHVSSPRPFG
jgi:hypothetical protein